MTLQDQAKPESDLQRFVCIMLSMLFLLSTVAGLATGGKAVEQDEQWQGLPDVGEMVVSGTRSDGDRGGSSHTVTMLSANISGSVLGGYMEIMDAREIYNSGGRTAMTYIFALTRGMNITGLDITTGSEVLSYQKRSDALSSQEVLDGGDIVFMHTVNAVDGGGRIEEYVTATGEPGLFSLSGHRLLVCQFPMDGSSFATISVRNSFQVGSIAV